MEARTGFRGGAVSKGVALVITVLVALILAAGASAASGQVKHVRAAGVVELTFTKWFYPHFPTSVGVVGGDITGTLAGQVLSRKLVADGQIVLFTARYDVNAGAQSFSVLIEGEQNNEIHSGVVNGVVTAGLLLGDRVHEEYNVISCTQAPSGLCFQGTTSIM